MLTTTTLNNRAPVLPLRQLSPPPARLPPRQEPAPPAPTWAPQPTQPAYGSTAYGTQIQAQPVHSRRLQASASHRRCHGPKLLGPSDPHKLSHRPHWRRTLKHHGRQSRAATASFLHLLGSPYKPYDIESTDIDGCLCVCHLVSDS